MPNQNPTREKDIFRFLAKLSYILGVVSVAVYLYIGSKSFVPPAQIPPVSFGYQADSSGTGYSTPFSSTPEFELAPGQYRIKVNYTADTPFATFFKLTYTGAPELTGNGFISLAAVTNKLMLHKVPLNPGTNAEYLFDFTVYDEWKTADWQIAIDNLPLETSHKTKVTVEMLPAQSPTRLILPFWMLAIPLLLPLILMLISAFGKTGRRAKLEALIENFLAMGFGFALLPSFAELFLALAVVVFILFLILEKGVVSFEWRRRDWALAVFVLIAITSGFFAFDAGTAIGAAFVFVLFYFIYQFLKSLPAGSICYANILPMSAWAIVLWGGFAVFHHAVLKTPFSITSGTVDMGWFSHLDGSGNLTSIFQYGSMGAYLTVLVSMFFSHYMFFNYKKIKVWEWFLYGAALGLTVLIVLLISGRGAMILMGSFWLGMAVLSRRWIYLIAFAVVGAGVLMAPIPKFRESLQTLTNPSQIPNMGGRLNQYKAAWQALTEVNPVFGIGLGNFHYHYKKISPVEYELDPVQFVHNGYLSILTETGFAGLAAYLFFMIAFFIYSVRRSIRNIRSSILGASLLLGFFLISLFDAIFYNVFLGMIVWMLLGLSQNTHYDDLLAIGYSEKTGRGKK